MQKWGCQSSGHNIYDQIVQLLIFDAHPLLGQPHISSFFIIMFFFIGLLFFMTFLNFNFEVYHQSLCSYWSTCLSLTFVPCGLSLMPLFLFLYFVAFTHLCHILGSIKLKVLFYFLMLFLNCTAFNDLRHSIWLFHYIYPFTLKRHMMISKQPTITFLLYPPCSGSMGLLMKVVTFGYTFCY